MIEVLQVSENDDCIDIAMDSGEREIISLYFTGAGDFIIIDDKKGAFFCRRKGIPYINALLAVKILYMLFLLPHKKFLEIYEWLKNNGRYSRTVIDWADNSTYNDLKFFLM